MGKDKITFEGVVYFPKVLFYLKYNQSLNK
mgnify:CR=1 FL=1